MSLAERVRLRPWMSCALAAGLAACGTAGMGSKVASSGDYAPATPRATDGYRRHDTSHAAAEPLGEPAPERPGLGTSWGETVEAPVSFAPFLRASAAPWAELAVHYNDASGVEAHAGYLGSRPEPLELVAGDGAVSVALVDDSGNTLPGFTAGGRTLVLGHDGQRYRIVVRNATPARFEIVTSVDGLDVIDGQPADPNRRGYLVDPHGVLTIDGFRMSDDAVAAFRFGRVAESYAAQTSGDRNVGVIGLAIFAERGAVWTLPESIDSGPLRSEDRNHLTGRIPQWGTPQELNRRDSADPFPQRGYATPPR